MENLPVFICAGAGWLFALIAVLIGINVQYSDKAVRKEIRKKKQFFGKM